MRHSHQPHLPLELPSGDDPGLLVEHRTQVEEVHGAGLDGDSFREPDRAKAVPFGEEAGVFDRGAGVLLDHAGAVRGQLSNKGR